MSLQAQFWHVLGKMLQDEPLDGKHIHRYALALDNVLSVLFIPDLYAISIVLDDVMSR
jgi:hypothetical protein